MEKKILKRFILLLSSLLLLVPIKISDACGWDWDPNEELDGNILMAPESSLLPDFSPFFLSNSLFYYDGSYYENSIGDYEGINTKEWLTYFGSNVTAEEVKAFIYSPSSDQLKFYRENSENKSAASAEYPMLKCDATKLKSALSYFEIAYQLNEHLRSKYEDWSYYEDVPENKNLQVNQDSLFTGQLKKLYQSAKDSFLKQRYAFQLTRIYFSQGAYDECIDFFDNEVVRYDHKSSMYTRAMGYKAAALHREKKFSEANFLYAQQFILSPEARRSAKWSFHPQEESDFNSTLALAQTAEEKCAVWLMFGLTADPAKALDEIYAINPGYEPARLLASRIINMYEANRGEYSAFYYMHYTYQERETESNLASIKKYAENKLSSEPAYWKLMTAYLYYRIGNTQEAQQWMASGKSSLHEGEEILKAHYILLEMLLRIEQSNTIDNTLQKDLAAFLTFNWCKDIKAIRKDAIYPFVCNRLYQKYKTEGNEIMMALSHHDASDYYNIDFGRKMLAFMKQPGHNELETLLLNNHYLKVNDLTYEIALAHLYHDELEPAVHTTNFNNEYILSANPFYIRNNDCHECDREMEQRTKYTRASLLNKMIEMERAAKLDPKASASTYFLLGNAFYNITYFGNNRLAFSSTLQGMHQYEYYNIFDPERAKEKDMQDIFDCSIAESYYLLAYKYAPNKEFAAKCLFMAAKCDQNAFFVRFKYPQRTYEDKYFKMLRAQYRDTKYFQEILSECGYFRRYMKENP